ncbi:MAG: hypothetical protein CMJ67_08975 [Planctomycetaceae bacterium]|nr:hypothetical protein [Planctomycetaceae bacterium]
MKRTALPNGWHVVDDRDVIDAEMEAFEGPAPIRFPGLDAPDSPSAAEEALRATDEVCRRMEVLARELHCLGDFDHDDGPRAA